MKKKGTFYNEGCEEALQLLILWCQQQRTSYNRSLVGAHLLYDTDAETKRASTCNSIDKSA